MARECVKTGINHTVSKYDFPHFKGNKEILTTKLFCMYGVLCLFKYNLFRICFFLSVCMFYLKQMFFKL